MTKILATVNRTGKKGELVQTQKYAGRFHYENNFTLTNNLLAFSSF